MNKKILKLSVCLLISVMWCVAVAVFMHPDIMSYLGQNDVCVVWTSVRILSYAFILFVLPGIALYLYCNLVKARRLYAELSSNENMMFYDYRHKLKLVLPSDSVVFIKSEKNYVYIYYLENDKVHHHVLRNTLKSIDELCQRHGMIQCQRCYYVNPAHVVGIGLDGKDSLFARLDIPDMQLIPVTKRYYDRLVEKIY